MPGTTQRTLPFVYKLAAGLAGLAAMFAIAMIFGAADVTLQDVWLSIVSGTGNEQVLLLREIRLPREVAALTVGAALAVSGAVMQGITRNPLADPGLLGLTAGANAALALSMALLPSLGTVGIVIACFLGAAGGTLLVFGIGSLRRGGFSPLRLVLAGAAISTFLYAVAEGIALYFHISQDVSLWNAGGLIGTTWSQLQIIVPVVAAGIIAAILLSRQLTVLSLSEEVAAGLGQNITLIRTALLIVIILLAGASVALAGKFVFLGLMIPHIVRAMVGTDYRFIIPMSAVAGAIFMLLADLVGRTLNAPLETPVVAVVAVIGLPFFLYVVYKGGREFS
ncbi:FecCD family ABC transporter permease [Paenibacillus gansuensis]|uniref:FecCD family ABC transporter permease n=1 Tax=Paenibacillus gansuensis TaxID=306542 RepID=A0ABW5PJ63_9BACL